MSIRSQCNVKSKSTHPMCTERQNAHDARSVDRLHAAARRQPCDTITRCAMCEMEHDLPLLSPPLSLPPSNYMYPIPASLSRLPRGRTGAAWLHRAYTSSASMAHGVSARHNHRLLSPGLAHTRRERRSHRWCDDPRMRRVREHRPPIDCIIIIPLFLSRARYSLSCTDD